MQVNGKHIPTYPIDNHESKLARIAYDLKTSPIFVSLEPDDFSDSKINITARNLYRDIESHAAKSYDFGELQAQLSNFKGSFEVLLYTWFSLLPDDGVDDERMKEYTIVSMTDMYPGKNIEAIIADHSLKQDISGFIIKQASIEKDLAELDNHLPVQLDEIIIHKINLEIRFAIDADLVEIFDRLQMSKEFPYANNGPSRHKIFRQFKYLGEGWEIGLPDAIQFYVLASADPPVIQHEKYYSQGIITMDEKSAILSIEATLSKVTMGIGKILEYQELIERVFSALRISVSAIIGKPIQKSINSIVNAPKQRFNRFLMADIIATNPLISMACFVDESTKIERKRSGVTFSYFVGEGEKVTITFTEVEAEIRDFQRSRDMYPTTSRYIRIRINKAQNIEKTKLIADFCAKIINIYNNSKDALIKEYAKYIPGFVELEQKARAAPLRKEKSLQAQVPEIFVSGYSRSCQSGNQPLIVDHLISSDEKGLTVTNVTDPVAELTYKQAILFPKTPEEGPQHWYACHTTKIGKEDHKWPGLRDNKLAANYDIFPLVPCCYKQPQTNRKNFQTYYHDHTLKHGIANYILKTPKILDQGSKGVLPPNLEKFFKLIARNRTFYRLGVKRSKQSFITACQIAFKYTDPVTLTPAMLATCRQNAYDRTPDELRNIIFNDEYTDPCLFYRGLEEFFKCYIYIFTRSPTDPGSIIHPQHKHTHLRYTREKRPIILVFEHLGTESDVAEYPVTELIVEARTGGYSAIFDDEGLCAEIEKMSSTTKKYYTGFHPQPDIPPEILPRDIVAQKIDSMGKTRLLIVKFKQQELNLICDPLPPLLVEEKSGGYRNMSEIVIKSYLTEEKYENIRRIADRYIATKNGRKYEIPFEITTTSTIKVYNQNERIARYLQEYIYYLYSHKKYPIEASNINRFLRENVIVKSAFVYPRIPRKFDLAGGYFLDGKLIVPSLEIAQRLGYSLEMMIRRHPRQLSEYSQLSYIQDYYLDKNDFAPRDNTIIFMTEDALKEWIGEASIEHILRHIPQDTSSSFYLELDNRVTLIQPAPTFDGAVYIANIWNTKGYNYPSVQTDEESNYMIYTFNSSDNIVIDGKSRNKVLVWRIGDKLYYGAILCT